MEYSYDNYANSTSSSYILNYTGKVKYYYLDSDLNTVDLQFQCQSANFRIDINGNIYWKSGTWITGQWYNGEFRNQITEDDGQTWQDTDTLVSIWKDGNWYDGSFYNGQWYDGCFYKGNWYTGYWYDGIFGYCNLLNQYTQESIWRNGYFFGGLFCGTQWQDGRYYNNGDIPSYWYSNYKKEYVLIWNGGYINDVYSSSQPGSTLSNNKQYIKYTDNISYFFISDNKYEIKQFSCSQSTFEIDNFGIITATLGNFYYGNISNADFTNCYIESCELTECTITTTDLNSCTLINCELSNNNKTVKNSTLYNGIFNGGTYDNNIFHDVLFKNGTIQNSYWYDGVFNYSETSEYSNYCFWKSSSIWYSGTWNYGYIDDNISTIAPYIVANSSMYQNFSGDLSYTYNQETHVISLSDATVSFTRSGQILFEEGNWLSGDFEYGQFYNGVFENGNFNSGTIQNSTWNNGNFNGGTFYSSVWNNGQFNDGIFIQSTWNNGNFNGGTFKKSVWNNGTFNNGDWITLGSFWFDGTWINGKQNGQDSSLNIITQNAYIIQNLLTQQQFKYVDQNDQQKTYTTSRMFKIDITSTNVSVKLYDQYGYQVTCNKITNINGFDNDFGYYIQDQCLYVYFKSTISKYYKLEYSYNTTDVTPKLRMIDDYLDYLSDDTNLVTGQFDYKVTDQDKTTYYTISVKDANFTIDNGYIIWKRGSFIDGTWYNGNWNTLQSQLSDLVYQNIQQLLYSIDKCIWYNGTWMNGNWNYTNSIWYNGTWMNGTVNNISCSEAPNFQLGNSKSYKDYTGKIKYCYYNDEVGYLGECQLQNAELTFDEDGFITFYNGIWVSGTWNNGTWYGDEWKTGTWNNGTWKCGIWDTGTWVSGTWQLNTKYTKNEDTYQQQLQYGCYKKKGQVLIQYKNIPSIGFFIDSCDIETFQSSTSSSSNSSFSSESSTNSNSLNNLISVQIKTWVDSTWKDGFIESIKSLYPPIYQVCNGKRYFNKSDSVVYKYKMYDDDGQFLYWQYFILNFSQATFQVDDDGNITWNAGVLINSIWMNGTWNNGNLATTIWNNGTWNNGNFYSGTWVNGTWNNGSILMTNTTWENGTWKKGYINNYYSQCSPNLTQANNKLFINYTGQLKYRDTAQYYKISVSNAYFTIDNAGFIVFFKGSWKDGTFINGIWKTADFNTDYSAISNDGKMIQFGTLYNFGILNYTYTQKKQNNFIVQSATKQIKSSKSAQLFIDTDQYVSIFENGTFSNGTWYNGQWVTGDWLTDDQNTPIGTWITGIVDGIVQTEAPAYIVVTQSEEGSTFANFTGRIKYKINQYDDINQVVLTYFETFSAKNACFKIKYIQKTKNDTTFRQTFIQWEDGIWMSGFWVGGIWNNGTFNSGTWRIGCWMNGIFNDGNWISGMWYNGKWYGGQRKDIRIMNQVY